MENAALLDLLLDRLEASELSDDASLLVLAAYQGQGELDEVLQGAAHGAMPQRPAPTPSDVPGSYLKSVEVTGFRGIGPRAALRLQAGPGLTLIVGRNGSGKSSFAEAAEVALTGTNARWTGRVKVWKEGWRNLHVDTPPAVAVELVVDGEPGVTTVTRQWQGDDVDVSAGWCQRQGHQREPVTALDWTDALRSFRPFLSYAELGSMLLGRPSELHDALFTILGLEAVASAQQRLKDAHKHLDEQAKSVSADQKRLVQQLTTVDDSRASAATAALKPRRPDLDALQRLLQAAPESHDDLAPLHRWAALRAPDPESAGEMAKQLDEAHQAQAALARTQSGAARRTAALLEQALAHAEHAASQDCPVCGAQGRLDGTWRASTTEQVQRLRREAAEADAADAALRQAREATAALAAPPPACVADVPGSGLAERWRAWSQAARGDDVEAAVRALRTDTPRLAADVAVAAAAARAELERRQDRWQPLAQVVAAFLASARQVEQTAALRSDLKEALDWLRGQADSLRNDRLAPVAARAARVWQLLRQESNVELGPVRLEGSATQRRVALDVTVDGVAGAALGVMSQGELHALALSLFLPRATLPESPFRFLVIDDPVQAMDPAKVDGLARVLAEVAQTHQVVVFTHDDRLPESVRRLQLPATVWQVTRRERSVVELTKVADPVQRYLDDARALANTTELPTPVAGRVVPGLCRGAVEAACQEAVRRRRLQRGDAHADVEDALQTATTTMQLAALALFDDAGRGGEVLGRLNSFGRWAADTFNACRRGAHDSYSGDLKSLVSDTERLVQRLRS